MPTGHPPCLDLNSVDVISVDETVNVRRAVVILVAGCWLLIVVDFCVWWERICLFNFEKKGFQFFVKLNRNVLELKKVKNLA